MSKTVFALIDCNNFYVSCERMFRPDLWQKPVAVLSNNDGCIVARSNELKNMGVVMAAPYFKQKEVLDKMGCVIFSSNYALYHDVSNRVMAIIGTFFDKIEVYSVDEAFVELPELPEPLMQEMFQELKNTVWKWLNIPISIGVAPTKTLAKLANEKAKKDGRKDNKFKGYFRVGYKDDINEVLSTFEIKDIWGIGRKYSKKLLENGIETALDFVKADPDWIQTNFSVNGARTQKELLGHRFYDLEGKVSKQGIASTRSFGKPVTSLKDLAEAVSSYTTIAAEKLRKEGLVTDSLSVFLMTNRFKSNFVYNNLSVKLAQASNSTHVLAAECLKLVKKLYKPGLSYAKAGVFLTNLHSQYDVTASLFEAENRDQAKDKRAMQAVDKINKKFGRDTLNLLSNGIIKPWQMQQTQVSPKVTTSWKELMTTVN